jgi:hypothetical protein
LKKCKKKPNKCLRPSRKALWWFKIRKLFSRIQSAPSFLRPTSTTKIKWFSRYLERMKMKMIAITVKGQEVPIARVGTLKQVKSSHSIS